MTVIVLNVHHHTKRFPVQPWLKTVMLCYLARIVRIKTHYDEQQPRSKPLTRTPSPPKLNHVMLTSSKDCNKNGGILDEMETMGLTAVLNTRFQQNGPTAQHTTHHHLSELNGPTSRPLSHHQLPKQTSLSSNISQNSETSGVRQRPRRYSKSREYREYLSSRGNSEEEPEVEADYSRDWHELAQVLDRFFFWLLFVMMTMSALLILLYPKYSGLERRQLSARPRK